MVQPGGGHSKEIAQSDRILYPSGPSERTSKLLNQARGSPQNRDFGRSIARASAREGKRVERDGAFIAVIGSF